MNFLGTLATTYTGNSMLTEELKTSIVNGAYDILATVKDAAGVTLVVIIGAIAFTVGINYALRKVRSVGSWAS